MAKRKKKSSSRSGTRFAKQKGMDRSSTERLEKLFAAAPAEDLAALYKRHGVEVEKGSEELAKAICLDGSNTIASLFRGWEGVAYLEVARDVASKLGIKAKEELMNDEAKLEQAILGKVIEKHLSGNADSDQFEEVKEILGKEGINAKEFKRAITTGTLAVIIAVLRKEIVEQIVRAIVAKASARAAATSAARLVGLAVPLLNLVLAAWTVFDIAGPAFRKTVPSIIEISLIRIQVGGDDAACNENDESGVDPAEAEGDSADATT